MNHTICPKCKTRNLNNAQCEHCGIFFLKYENLKIQRLKEIYNLLSGLDFLKAKFLCEKLIKLYPENEAEYLKWLSIIINDGEMQNRFFDAEKKIQEGCFAEALAELSSLDPCQRELKEKIILLRNKLSSKLKNIEYLKMVEEKIVSKKFKEASDMLNVKKLESLKKCAKDPETDCTLCVIRKLPKIKNNIRDHFQKEVKEDGTLIGISVTLLFFASMVGIPTFFKGGIFGTIATVILISIAAICVYMHFDVKKNDLAGKNGYNRRVCELLLNIFEKYEDIQEIHIIGLSLTHQILIKHSGNVITINESVFRDIHGNYVWKIEDIMEEKPSVSFSEIDIDGDSLDRCELIFNNTIETVVNKGGNKAGRAIVGGLIAGPVGAVVGAATAKSETAIQRSKIESAILKLHLTKGNNRIFELSFIGSFHSKYITERAAISAAEYWFNQFKNLCTSE